ncbi:hypothetical protein SUGI_0297510 [Cryptomeria japonica]|nr:hypothetical protein SUGI_0297510 [Cryptomeria japonica]
MARSFLCPSYLLQPILCTAILRVSCKLYKLRNFYAAYRSNHHHKKLDKCKRESKETILCHHLRFSIRENLHASSALRKDGQMKNEKDMDMKS